MNSVRIVRLYLSSLNFIRLVSIHASNTLVFGARIAVSQSAPATNLTLQNQKNKENFQSEKFSFHLSLFDIILIYRLLFVQCVDLLSDYFPRIGRTSHPLFEYLRNRRFLLIRRQFLCSRLESPNLHYLLYRDMA